MAFHIEQIVDQHRQSAFTKRLNVHGRDFKVGNGLARHALDCNKAFRLQMLGCDPAAAVAEQNADEGVGYQSVDGLGTLPSEGFVSEDINKCRSPLSSATVSN